jgi:hypothetical protein
LDRDTQSIRVVPSRVLWVLLATTGFLIIAGLGSQVLKFATGHHRLYGLVPFFELQNEQGAGDFYSSTLMLLAAGLLAVIAVLKRASNGPYTARWLVLSVGFLYLAIDEASDLHALFSRPTAELLGSWAPGVFQWSWVIPGILCVMLVGLFFVGFLKHLPVHSRTLFLVTGGLFVGGAIGIEMIGGTVAAQYGQDTLTFGLIWALKESLEMLAMSVFVYAVLDYMMTSLGAIRIQFSKEPGPGE